MQNMYLDEVKTILIDVLSLGDAGQHLMPIRPCWAPAGARFDGRGQPDRALEERFGIAIDDDDISASTFETLGTLAAFVAQKQSE